MALKVAVGFQKLAILLYKGCLLRKRHYIITTFEFIFPVLLAAIPAILQSEADILNQASKQKPEWINDTTYFPFNPFTSGPRGRCQNCIFAYAPSNKFTDMFMNDSLQAWKDNHLGSSGDIKAFNNNEAMEDYCLNKQRTDQSATIIGTIFNGVSSTQESLPPNLDYTIRYSSEYMPRFSTDSKYQFSDVRKSNVYASSTYFLSWQAAVEKTFIRKKMMEENKMFEYKIFMQEFPFPGHKASSIGTLWKKAIIPVMIVYGFLVFVINLTRRVIEEKSNGSKELMKMMGMTDCIYWSSAFLNYFVVGAVVCCIITIIYKAPLKDGVMLFENSNFFVLLIIFLLFMASLTLFSLALTTFFNKAVFGITVMILAYCGTYSLFSSIIFPSEEIEIKYIPLSFFAKFCICLLPPGSVLTMFEIILDYEEAGDGVHWSNLFNTDVVFGFSVFWLMMALLFSCLLYVILIWYIDAVWPWQYGVPKPFYFPFTKSYWCGYEEKDDDDILLNPNEEAKSSEFFEDDPIGISPGVVIRNLSKVFRTGFQTKIAVKNLSLNIYDSEITALLGHNGAGKTTTINILTGMFLPSSGTASINGWDIFSQTSKARQSIGVCPQHNVLYDTLTVEEHLKIYAGLKGVKWRQLNEESDKVLKMVHLTDKKNEIAKNLSGGMKRKLSLGIAIVGGSKILFLDEPTSGMDVETRRNVWDTLLEIRPNHSIILTTHYMEEADVLGDRIAIMANGEIQCCGSSLFLKKKFGTGYHLHLVKKENFDIDAVQGVLSNFVPSANIVNDYEGEVTFNLMSNSASSFGPLFEDLEQKKDNLGINSCGLTVTTMDDVFLKVSSLADIKYKSEADLAVDENAEALEMKDIYIESKEFGRSQNFCNQFLGLFMKRLAYSKRHWSILASLFVIPFLLICACLSIIEVTSGVATVTEPSLQLDIRNVYGKTEGFYSFDNTDPTESMKLIMTEIKTAFRENNIDGKSTDDPETYVLDFGRQNLADYFKKLMVGGSVASDNALNITAWFNGYPYHAEPMALLLMDTAILKSVDESATIKLTNNPFPVVGRMYVDESYTKEKLLSSIFLPLALSYLSASFVLVPIHERVTKAKLLQMMTGISPATYWIAMFAWDFVINIIVSIFLIIPFAIFVHYAFFSPHSEAIGTALLLLILYGWSSIPFSYLFTFLFKKPNTGFSVVNLICVLSGTAIAPVFATVLQLPYFQDINAVKAFSWLLKIFPSFAIGSGFGNLFAISFANAFCESIDPKYLKFYCTESPRERDPIFKCCRDICGSNCLNETNPITMELDGCGRDILFLFIGGIIFFLLLLLLESSLLKFIFHRACQEIRALWKKVDSQTDSTLPEDSDVLQEEARVHINHEQVSHNDALVSLNLTKIFGNTVAVNSLTFGIHKKECFGLLGVNGAGKTTTFRMLTGDCFPTSGNAYINSYSVIKDLKEFQSHLGYCPQFDALIDRLSARETITLFARLRGLSGPTMDRYVNALIKMTDLTQYADKPSMVYSGGNKRKLSIALALIGAPPLILLDEPTAGVDPVSRRKIWKILSLARIHSGASVILTTHSMEESEALCSRLAIMVNGRFRCLGSIQHLKSKFGQGYTVIIKMKKEDAIPQSMNAVKEYIDTNLPGANLKYEHQGMLQYHVVDSSLTLSSLFRFMDNMQKQYNLEDYLISDTSLEQIFLAFARSQILVEQQVVTSLSSTSLLSENSIVFSTD